MVQGDEEGGAVRDDEIRSEDGRNGCGLGVWYGQRRFEKGHVDRQGCIVHGLPRQSKVRSAIRDQDRATIMRTSLRSCKSSEWVDDRLTQKTNRFRERRMSTLRVVLVFFAAAPSMAWAEEAAAAKPASNK